MQYRERLRALSLRTKVIGVAGIVAAIMAALFATMIQRDQRVALFSEPLRPEQVSEVTQRLAEWNVGFVAGADNVRVDQRRRNDLLLRLALAGVPHAHVPTSAELLEKVGPLTPSPVLEAEQRDGLAGDLELALRGVAGIDDARVIVAPARQGTFADDAGSAASAGVRLTLHPGVALSRDVVERDPHVRRSRGPRSWSPSASPSSTIAGLRSMPAGRRRPRAVRRSLLRCSPRSTRSSAPAAQSCASTSRSTRRRAICTRCAASRLARARSR